MPYGAIELPQVDPSEVHAPASAGQDYTALLSWLCSRTTTFCPPVTLVGAGRFRGGGWLEHEQKMPGSEAEPPHLVIVEVD